jgi:hypothetical protein
MVQGPKGRMYTNKINLFHKGFDIFFNVQQMKMKCLEDCSFHRRKHRSQNLKGSVTICYISFRTVPRFPPYSPTCYRAMLRGQGLTPSATNNTHKHSIVNPLLYMVY